MREEGGKRWRRVKDVKREGSGEAATRIINDAGGRKTDRLKGARERKGRVVGGGRRKRRKMVGKKRAARRGQEVRGRLAGETGEGNGLLSNGGAAEIFYELNCAPAAAFSSGRE